MLVVNKNKTIRFKFSFNNGSIFYDPLLEETPEDVYISINRGINSYGSIILSPISLINSSYRISSITASAKDSENYIHPTFTFSVKHTLKIGDEISVYGVGGNYDGSYLVESVVSDYGVTAKSIKLSSLLLSQFNNSLYVARAVKKTDSYIERISESEYNFIYTVPTTLFAGHYTVVIKTTYSQVDQTNEISFQVTEEISKNSVEVTAKELTNSVATIYTNKNHGFFIGDYISLSGADILYDGNYYISNTNSDTEFSFELNIPDQPFETVYPYGTATAIDIQGVSPVLSGPNQPTKISYRPAYDSLTPYSTNSILLIGHADGMPLNDITRVKSIQEAANILGADNKSPLLRAIFEAYNSGAKDIFITCVAPMSEYIEDINDRLNKKAFLLSEDSTPVTMNFYEKYYERLSATYSVVKDYEFIDIIVPVEISMINTGDVDFVTQLAEYCLDFHNSTGFVQLGVIGSRSGGIKDSDIKLLENNLLFKNKFTSYNAQGEISSDIGRFIIPVYGEVNFSHTGFANAYAASAASAFAGTMSNNPVYNGMIRKRLPAAFSLYGGNLSADSLSRLDNMCINTVYRNRRGNSGNPYEIYVSNDYTMAAKNSIFSKTPQMRLAAMVINQIKSLAYDSIGKFSYEKITTKVEEMLSLLVSAQAIRSYTLDAYADRLEKGKLIFEISLISSLNLKNIKFSVSTGPGA